MGIPISKSAQAEAAAGGSFAPIPAGKYNATIFGVSREVYGPNSNNAGREYLKVQYRLSDGVFENRRLFENVPLFSEWVGGKTAFAFFSFFTALGYDLETEEFDVPSNAELSGQPINLSVKVKFDDYSQEDRNEVGRHAAYVEAEGSDAVSALLGAGAKEIVQDPWTTAGS